MIEKRNYLQFWYLYVLKLTAKTSKSHWNHSYIPIRVVTVCHYIIFSSMHAFCGFIRLPLLLNCILRSGLANDFSYSTHYSVNSTNRGPRAVPFGAVAICAVYVCRRWPAAVASVSAGRTRARTAARCVWTETCCPVSVRPAITLFSTKKNSFRKAATAKAGGWTKLISRKCWL